MIPSAAAAPQKRAAAARSRWTTPCGPSRAANAVTGGGTQGAGPQRRAAGIGPSRLVRAQEAEEFHALAQAALHHLPAHQHLPHDLPDLSRAEIEPLVEPLELVVDLLARQVLVPDRRELNSTGAHEVRGLVLLEPAVLDGLLVKRSSGIRSRKRHLDRERIHFLCVLDR